MSTKSNAAHPPLVLLSDNYQELVDKVSTLAHSLRNWNEERSILLTFKERSQLTAEESMRLCDLNSSLDTFEEYLSGLGEIPCQPWIDRANAA